MLFEARIFGFAPLLAGIGIKIYLDHFYHWRRTHIPLTLVGEDVA